MKPACLINVFLHTLKSLFATLSATSNLDSVKAIVQAVIEVGWNQCHTHFVHPVTFTMDRKRGHEEESGVAATVTLPHFQLLLLDLLQSLCIYLSMVVRIVINLLCVPTHLSSSSSFYFLHFHFPTFTMTLLRSSSFPRTSFPLHSPNPWDSLASLFYHLWILPHHRQSILQVLHSLAAPSRQSSHRWPSQFTPTALCSVLQ